MEILYTILTEFSTPMKQIKRIKTYLIFFNLYSGSGVQLVPHGTAVTNRFIVPTPGDYDDGEIGGMMIARETVVLG
jgi:hypothetical protein